MIDVTALQFTADRSNVLQEPLILLNVVLQHALGRGDLLDTLWLYLAQMLDGNWTPQLVCVEVALGINL